MHKKKYKNFTIIPWRVNADQVSNFKVNTVANSRTKDDGDLTAFPATKPHCFGIIS